MALLFLRQLGMCGRNPPTDNHTNESGDSDVNKIKSLKPNHGIELRLASRKKQDTDRSSLTSQQKFFDTPGDVKTQGGSLKTFCRWIHAQNRRHAENSKHNYSRSSMHEATLSGVPATKRYTIELEVCNTHGANLVLLRDIFYRDVQLFRTQRVVDTVGNRRIDYGLDITDHNS